MNKMLSNRENEEHDSALLIRNRREEYKRTDADNKFNNERIKELKKKSRCHNCRELGHWWQDNVCSRKDNRQYGQRKPESSKSTARLTETRDTIALVTQSMILTSVSEAMLAQDNTQEVWYADAGATEHMSDNRAAFIDFQEVPKGTWPVAITNDQSLWVQGKGNIRIKRRAHNQWLDGILHNVLYIPELRTNLFSIGRAADRGIVTIYRKNTCQMIADNGEGEIILTGIRTGSSLYKLQMKTYIQDNATSQAYHVSTEAPEPHTDAVHTGETSQPGDIHKDTIEMWHHRFCHVNTQALRQTKHAVQGMSIKDNKTTKFFCEGCILGKQHRISYPALTEKERNSIPGTYFHIDLCGPMSTISIGGASYFMLCKDDNTGYMIIFFLKTKSEALIYLKQLYSMMKQELHVDIQRIKTDQGGEFKNQQFEEYTQEKGIIHEFSAPYSSEQNGYIERNNRTIVEATRSMLHSKDLPLSLWAKAANTSVHIWNRTISSQRSDHTPYERMFKQIPDVSYFRVFGSDAYLHIPKKQISKLEAKNRKLIFVGYDQKGRVYILWQPKTKRIHIGTDVIIHETLGTLNTEHKSSSTESYLSVIGLPSVQQPVIPAAAPVVPNIQQ